MDEDEVGAEVVGSLLFDTKDLVEGKMNNKFFWKNVYGSPMNQADGEDKRNMNANPEIASNWKGRVLVQTECYETKKPIAKVEMIDEKRIDDSREFTKKRPYQIIAEVGQGVALPESNKKYKVKLIIGGTEFKTDDPKVHKSNYNRWN